MQNPDTHRPIRHATRREFLWNYGGGLGGVALASLLGQSGLLPAATASPLPGVGRGGALQGGLHFPARAKRVIQLYMSGAASQCDTFDYKPLLIQKHGQKWDPGEQVELFQSSPGACMQSPWKWKQYGQRGKWLNDCVAPLGDCVDDMAFIHNMVTKSNVHGPATFMQATGFILPGFPSAGAWVSYGLGSLADNLPTFVVLPDPRGFAPNGPRNWGAGFLPAEHQGTMIRAGAPTPIADLFPPDGTFVQKQSEPEVLDALERINRAHEAAHPGDSRLDARIHAYEMAARMQLSAPQVLDISGEPQHILDLYGIDAPNVKWNGPMNPGEETRSFGRNCLVARRLLERGVRFVQLFCGAHASGVQGLLNWDAHDTLKADYDRHGPIMDQPTAALLIDLKRRGMLDDTLVIWTTEFGRMPTHQLNSQGRDHNPFGFTAWLAGGGARPGHTHGATDDLGYKAVTDECSIYDFHATILHLLGLNHEQLTFYHNGSRRRLTDVHGRVVREIVG
jgi:hypothetical protein